MQIFLICNTKNYNITTINLICVLICRIYRSSIYLNFVYIYFTWYILEYILLSNCFQQLLYCSYNQGFVWDLVGPHAWDINDNDGCGAFKKMINILSVSYFYRASALGISLGQGWASVYLFTCFSSLVW